MIAEKKLDPMLQAALDRLVEIGPTWRTPDQERWCALFVATVDLIYPAKKPRKSRAKGAS